MTIASMKQDRNIKGKRMNGRISAVYGNLAIAESSDRIVQNSIGYCHRSDGTRLLSEVIRVRGRLADLQVFEDTRGLKAGDPVELQNEMLSVVLAPGLLGQIYDGLQNPLPELAEQVGYFLREGVYINGVSTTCEWDFTPVVEQGELVEPGDTLGTVVEGVFAHQVMVPLRWRGRFTVREIVPADAVHRRQANRPVD